MSFISQSIEIYLVASSYKSRFKPSESTALELHSLIHNISNEVESIDNINKAIANMSNEYGFVINRRLFLDFQGYINRIKHYLFTLAVFLENNRPIEFNNDSIKHPASTNIYDIFAESINLICKLKPWKDQPSLSKHKITNAQKTKKELQDIIHQIETINALILSYKTVNVLQLKSDIFDLASCYYKLEKLVYCIVESH